MTYKIIVFSSDCISPYLPIQFNSYENLVKMMEIKTINESGEMFQEVPLSALNNIQNEESLRSKKEPSGVLDLRSGGIAFVRGMSVVIQFGDTAPISIQNQKEMLVIIPAGTIARIAIENNPGWTVGVTPSGNMIALPGHKSILELKSESVPLNVLDVDGVLSLALDWEFNGHVCHWSQQVVDNLIRVPFGLKKINSISDDNALAFSPSAFNRCILLLNLIPSLDIKKMKGVSDYWTAISENWEKIKEAFDSELDTGRGLKTKKEIELALAPVYEKKRVEMEEIEKNKESAS